MPNYLAETQEEKRSAERDRYSAKQLYPYFTGRMLDSLSPIDIRQYIQKRRTDQVQPATINKELRLLSVAINHAQSEWGWRLNNPVTRRTLAEPEGRARWITQAEAQTLIEAAEAEPQATHYLPDFIQLAINTGMRRGELLGLEWNRVDFSAHLIHLAGFHTKSGKHRSIPINASARNALIHRARFRAEHCPASPWVFCHADGEGIASIRRSLCNGVSPRGDYRFSHPRPAPYLRRVAGECRSRFGRSA